MKERMDWRQMRELLLSQVEPLPEQRLPVIQAVGMCLSRAVTAQWDVPPFDRSPYDGYAFRASDSTGELPVTLEVQEEIPAGQCPTKEVQSGAAAKILTGAPMPFGADCITKFEETTFTPQSVTLHRAYRSGENVIRRGEDMLAGDVLAQTGQVLDAGLCGALAAQGMTEVWVHSVPKVGILTIGGELVENGTKPSCGKIPNANRMALEAAVRLLGCEAEYLGSPNDDVEAIAEGLSDGLERCDLVLTTGGVSVGDYDLTPEGIKRVGCTVLGGDLALRPGGKSCFGQKGKTLVTALSGNPASAMTCFYAVAAPVLRKLQGHSQPAWPEVTAYLSEEHKKVRPVERLLRGRLWTEEGKLYFTPAKQQGNGAIHALSEANGMAVIPAGAGPMQKGAPITVLALEGCRR